MEARHEAQRFQPISDGFWSCSSVHGAVRVLTVTLAAFCFLSAVAVCFRFAVGAFSPSIGVAGLATAGLVMLAVGASLRVAWIQICSADCHPAELLSIVVLPALSLSLWAVVFSRPDLPPAALAIFWGTFLCEEIATISGALKTWRAARTDSLGVRLTNDLRIVGSPDSQFNEERNQRSELVDIETEEESLPDPDVTQVLTRRRDEQGQEVIHGYLRAEFSAGGRHTSIHVAFCPPFSLAPTIEAHQLEGPDARVTVAQRQPFGARFDIRLSRVTVEPCCILLEVMVQQSSVIAKTSAS